MCRDVPGCLCAVPAVLHFGMALLLLCFA